MLKLNEERRKNEALIWDIIPDWIINNVFMLFYIYKLHADISNDCQLLNKFVTTKIFPKKPSSQPSVTSKFPHAVP
jgi:hypothetical protein